MEENKAIINKIIDFSNVDGPGNRTTIFFQSCPFNCLYCHNPETIKKCNNCGTCVSKCPNKALSINNRKVVWNKDLCSGCDTCIKVCPNSSSPKTTVMTVDEVLTIIKRNKPFIRGITVSGGECMEYARFLTLLFKEVKKLGLTTFIDSNGYFNFSYYPELLEVTDKVMLDVKAYDKEFHYQLTGQDNVNVFRNLDYLMDHDKLYEVRTVLLNNNKEQNLKTVLNVARFIDNRCKYKLIKYRPYGVRKENLERLGNEEFDNDEFNKIADKAREIMNNIEAI